MDHPKGLYRNREWFSFAARVKQRDGYRCLQCGRRESEVTLQVHHSVYVIGKAPWEYPLSDCRTLCKGCHAREHGLIEPNCGWTLLAIHDRGGADGICQRKGCGAEIRYEHQIYHPQWGYLLVGSTCIEHLSQKEIALSHSVIELYKKISRFIHKAVWQKGVTQQGHPYLTSSYKHHQIRIYGQEQHYAFQLVLKEKGRKWHDFKKSVAVDHKSLLSVKELAFTALRGTLSQNEEERSVLRNLYRELMAHP